MCGKSTRNYTQYYLGVIYLFKCFILSFLCELLFSFLVCIVVVVLRVVLLSSNVFMCTC